VAVFQDVVSQAVKPSLTVGVPVLRAMPKLKPKTVRKNPCAPDLVVGALAGVVVTKETAGASKVNANGATPVIRWPNPKSLFSRRKADLAAPRQSLQSVDVGVDGVSVVGHWTYTVVAEVHAVVINATEPTVVSGVVSDWPKFKPLIVTTRPVEAGMLA